MKQKHKKRTIMGKAIRIGDRFVHEHGVGTVAFITDYPAGGHGAKMLSLNPKHAEDTVHPNVVIKGHIKYTIIRD